MTKHAAFTTASCCSCILLILSGGGRHAAAAPPGQVRFSVRAFGATGDGKTLDTDAVNHAIAAAADAGGGVVEFPAGDYLCHSIRLRSHVAIHLGPGATIIAANPPREGATGGYDPAEPQPLEPVPGLRALALAQQPDLGRGRTGSTSGCAGSAALSA